MLNNLLGIVSNASEHGRVVEHMLEMCHWFMLILGVGWGTFFLMSVYKFRKSKNPRADYHGVKGSASTHGEITVILIEASLLLGFALPLWGRRVVEVPNQAEAMRVRAIGEQYAWNFHYTGADGVFGAGDAVGFGEVLEEGESNVSHGGFMQRGTGFVHLWGREVAISLCRGGKVREGEVFPASYGNYTRGT